MTDAPKPSQVGPTKGAEIKIVRVARKCRWNDDVDAGKVKSTRLYDFDVLIDGERRAQFRPGIYRGFDLYDIDGERIKPRTWYFGRSASDVRKIGDFQDHIACLLTEGLIPTSNQIEQRRVDEARKAAEDDAKQKKEDELERIRAEAGTVYSESGLSPRALLEQRDEAVAANERLSAALKSQTGTHAAELKAREAETIERCAKVVERRAFKYDGALRDAAAAIRALARVTGSPPQDLHKVEREDDGWLPIESAKPQEGDDAKKD